MKVRGNIERHHQPPTPSAIVGNIEGNANFPSIFLMNQQSCTNLNMNDCLISLCSELAGSPGSRSPYHGLSGEAESTLSGGFVLLWQEGVHVTIWSFSMGYINAYIEGVEHVVF
ncbi:unnamed protein product [Prunus brigantina]